MGALGLRIAQMAGWMWRPVLAAAVMYPCVTAFVNPIDFTRLTAAAAAVKLAWLATGGALIYFMTVATLWFALGRTDGAERVVVSQVATQVARLFARKRYTA